MSEMFDFKNYKWRKMANNGEKWRKMAMANLPFSFVKFAISPLAPPPGERFLLKLHFCSYEHMHSIHIHSSGSLGSSGLGQKTSSNLIRLELVFDD